MLSGKPRLMKTQGQSPLDPCSNIRRSLSAVWTLALTTRQGEGRAQPDSPARPSQPPELIEKTWSPGPSCALPDWSPPSLPSISQFHYPPWPDVHFIKHAIMHSNSCVDKPPLTGPPRDNNNNKKKMQCKQFGSQRINVRFYISYRSRSQSDSSTLAPLKDGFNT